MFKFQSTHFLFLGLTFSLIQTDLSWADDNALKNKLDEVAIAQREELARLNDINAKTKLENDQREATRAKALKDAKLSIASKGSNAARDTKNKVEILDRLDKVRAERLTEIAPQLRILQRSPEKEVSRRATNLLLKAVGPENFTKLDTDLLPVSTQDTQSLINLTNQARDDLNYCQAPSEVEKQRTRLKVEIEKNIAKRIETQSELDTLAQLPTLEQYLKKETAPALVKRAEEIRTELEKLQEQRSRLQDDLMKTMHNDFAEFEEVLRTQITTLGADNRLTAAYRAAAYFKHLLNPSAGTFGTLMGKTHTQIGKEDGMPTPFRLSKIDEFPYLKGWGEPIRSNVSLPAYEFPKFFGIVTHFDFEKLDLKAVAKTEAAATGEKSTVALKVQSLAEESQALDKKITDLEFEKNSAEKDAALIARGDSAAIERGMLTHRRVPAEFKYKQSKKANLEKEVSQLSAAIQQSKERVEHLNNCSMHYNAAEEAAAKIDPANPDREVLKKAHSSIQRLREISSSNP